MTTLGTGSCDRRISIWIDELEWPSSRGECYLWDTTSVTADKDVKIPQSRELNLWTVFVNMVGEHIFQHIILRCWVEHMIQNAFVTFQAIFQELQLQLVDTPCIKLYVNNVWSRYILLSYSGLVRKFFRKPEIAYQSPLKGSVFAHMCMGVCMRMHMCV